MKTVVPYNNEVDKKQQVEEMFDRIAPKYDFLNDFLSLGIENRWKRKFIKLLKKNNVQRVLDVATGTGDLVISLTKLNPKEIIGIDLSKQMLDIARKKVSRKIKGELKVTFYHQAVEEMDFGSEEFDLITCAFGVRNFGDLPQGIHQMYRVLRKGGRLAIMEFSKSTVPVFSKIYNFYFEKFLPYLGGLISRDFQAYKYLPVSVRYFPEQTEFVELVKNEGFVLERVKTMTLGIVSIYIFKK